MRQPAGWIVILVSLFFACGAQASPRKKSHARRSGERSSHATYRTARYARQTGSHTSHPAARATSKSHHYVRHHYTRRRRSYHHRVRLPKAPTSERITQIQSALARGGYYQGDPTGKWDQDTVAAVQKFQSANNMDATGKLDATTLQKLGLGSDIAGVAAPKPVVPKMCCTASPAEPASTPAKPASTVNAPAAANAQPVSTASGNPPNSAAGAGASSASTIAPPANAGTAGASDPASSSKPNSDH